MADVWEAHDQVLSRDVAIKVLQRQYATDEVFLERFRREAVAAARLAHPGVVATYDAGVDGSTTYIVMELVRGRTLRDFLAERGPLSAWLTVGIALQIADALIHAHQAGIIHRDIKPANILICDGNEQVPRVKVTDFGIAKAAAGLGGDLTRTGMVLGTPRYLSPEQVQGAEPDARADLYALGVVIYEMLIGQSPFAGSTEMSMALARLNRPAPRVRSVRPDVPRRLEAVVAELLARDPDRRPPSAAALHTTLASLQASLTAPRRAPASLGGPLGVTTVVAGRQRRWGTRGTTPPASGFPASNGSANHGTGRVQPAPSLTATGDRRDRFPQSGPVTAPTRRPVRKRSGRGPAAVVGALAVAGLVVAALLLTGGGHHRTTGVSSGPSASSVPISIATVKVWVVPPQHSPDNPGEVKYTYDGNPNTYWSTDRYATSNFGGYGGEGLAIEVNGTRALHQLHVTSISQGWAASTYVAQADEPTLAAWGQPTAQKSDIPGSTTFDLGGRQGRWVMLWMTNTGPRLSLDINELSVS